MKLESWRQFLDADFLACVPTSILLLGITTDELIPKIMSSTKDFVQLVEGDDASQGMDAIGEVYDAFNAELDRRIPVRRIDEDLVKIFKGESK